MQNIEKQHPIDNIITNLAYQCISNNWRYIEKTHTGGHEYRQCEIDMINALCPPSSRGTHIKTGWALLHPVGWTISRDDGAEVSGVVCLTASTGVERKWVFVSIAGVISVYATEY